MLQSPLPRDSPLHDGECGKHSTISPSRRLGHFHRSCGYLFPHTHPHRLPKMSSISDSGHYITIPGTVVWPFSSTLGILQDYDRDQNAGTCNGHHVSGQPNSTPVTTHPQEIERPCRHSVMPFPDVRYRIVSTSIYLLSTDTGMGNPIIGSVCNEVKWRIFTAWCNIQHINPLLATESVVSDFLFHLHTEKHLAISTMAGYQMAIANTLCATCGVEVGRNSAMKLLL